jgi:PAS domain S-box-containing protein
MFSRRHPTTLNWPPPAIERTIFSLSAGLAALAVATRSIIADASLIEGTFRREPGVLYSVYVIYFIAVWFIGLCLLAVQWLRARGLPRAQLDYLGAGILLGGSGGIVFNLLVPWWTGNASYIWVGPYGTLVFVALVAHAIIRHRLLDLRLVVHRGLTFVIAIVVSLAPVVLLLAFVWPKLLDHLNPQELVAVLGAIVVVSVLIPVVRDAAGQVLDRYVYRTRANYQRTLREVSRTLTRVLDRHTLLTLLNDTVARTTAAEGAGVYLREGDQLMCAIATQQHTRSHFATPPEAPTAILRHLSRTRDFVVTEELAAEPPTEDTRPSLAALTSLGWALVLPVISDDVVIGAIAVGPKLSGDPYYPQDLDLLMTLANQAGVAVKNAQLYAAVVLANEYIQSIVATIESGVVAIDGAAKITMFNRAAEQLTGLAADRVKSRAVTSLPGCLADTLAGTLSDGTARTSPEIDLPSGAGVRPVICTTSPLVDPSGTVLGAVAVFSDLTPLKELEIERRRAEKLAYFEVLASGIAHEIKNPLVAIKTFAQLLPRRKDDERFVQDFGRIVAREIGRMEHLTERLWTLSRPGERPRHPVDVRGPLADALEFLAPAFEEKRVRLTARLGEAPAVVIGNAGELEALFINILKNAYEATPPEGTVTVELVLEKDQVAIAIADTGAGIPTELLERVFEPFFTTKGHGSGLGLTLCAGIAQNHGARLRAAHGGAGGTVFTLDIPLASAVPTSVGA